MRTQNSPRGLARRVTMLGTMAVTAGMFILTPGVAQAQPGSLPTPSPSPPGIRALPDLIVLSHDDATGVMTVKNIGNAPATRSTALYVAGRIRQAVLIRALAPGAQITFPPNRTLTLNCAAVTVDSNNFVHESNEHNNFALQGVCVR
jgi:CARDB